MQNSDVVPLAAIRFQSGDPIDALLEDVTRELLRRGIEVAGFLQQAMPVADDCCSIMYLDDIGSGGRSRISMDLGRQSRGCRLDFAAVAELSQRLLASIPCCDLLVLNRFGKGEAEGSGFRQVIAAAAEADVPVLTAVRHPYLEAWSTFTDGIVHELPPEKGPVVVWCVHQARRRRTRRNEAFQFPRNPAGVIAG
jgi:hypothetical protein